MQPYPAPIEAQMQLYRAGQLYTQQQGVEVFDHDWASLAEGVAIPHGLYD